MEKNSRFVIGVDVGATFVKIAKVDLRGSILSKDSIKTKDFQSRDSMISEIVKIIDRLSQKEKKHLAGVGVGIPGPVDYEKGVVFNLTNIKGWKNIPIKSILSKRLKGIPVFVDNDANAASIGEATWGAARGSKNIVCITLGSGLGGGVIIDGKVYRGRSYSAAELGHICIDRNGPKCNCGSNGCFEAFVGNSYMVKDVIKKIKSGKKTQLLALADNKLSNITPKLLDKAAQLGDKFSAEIWNEMGRNVGIGLSSIINIFNPEIIVIGGGVSKASKHIFSSIKKTIRERSMEIFRKGLKINRAKFVENAGVVGAAALAVKELVKLKQL